ncbi:hypothetical protein G3I62_27255 [Streptomyces sp. SID14446]|uniref:hypothetical protein n=1 Tax=Streptomyces sp. SID14446 TaxID=2706072 RepID=UPI0013B5FF6F|nr:hypothetical protein [Streptomyces sp. SID14446]NEB32747.1 hypothetical protein [Streptomyces sp. SID14446]
MTSPKDTCARDGCSFHPELILIGETPLPAVYCGDACADVEWFRKALEDSAPTPSVAESWQTLNALERLLNTRSEPFAVGPLIAESLYGR